MARTALAAAMRTRARAAPACQRTSQRRRRSEGSVSPLGRLALAPMSTFHLQHAFVSQNVIRLGQRIPIQARLSRKQRRAFGACEAHGSSRRTLRLRAPEVRSCAGAPAAGRLPQLRDPRRIKSAARVTAARVTAARVTAVRVTTARVTAVRVTAVRVTAVRVPARAVGFEGTSPQLHSSRCLYSDNSCNMRFLFSE